MGIYDDVNFVTETMPEKDVYIVLKVIKKVIELLKYEPLISDEEFQKLTPFEKYQELMTVRFCSIKFSDKVDVIFIRFVGDETPLAGVVFFPMEAVWSFLIAARNYYNVPGTTLSEEEIENLAFIKATDMLILLLRNIYPRVMAMMNAITDETINEWLRQEHDNYREYCAKHGIFIPSLEPQIKKARQEIIKEYSKEVGTVWEQEGKRLERYLKFRLLEEYETLYKHWETISLLYRSDKDWTGYAKMPGFEDTPDDLLEEMKGSHHRGMSLKALEHAARRVGLINKDCSDSGVLEKRKSGIQCSGFSDTTLYKYLEEGKNVRQYLASRNLIGPTPPEPKRLAE